MAAWPYCTKQWRLLRERVLREEPLCRYCQEMGLIQASEHVDHIKPVRTHRHLAFNRSNLQGLCAHCHNSVKQREERTGNKGVLADGYPADPEHSWFRKT